jgi:hypothetical protein
MGLRYELCRGKALVPAAERVLDRAEAATTRPSGSGSFGYLSYTSLRLKRLRGRSEGTVGDEDKGPFDPGYIYSSSSGL